MPLNLVQCLRGSIQTDPVTFFSTKSKSRFSLILRNDFYGLAQNLSQISVGSQVIYPNDFCDPDIGNAKERRCLFFRELSCITFLIILSYSSYKCSAHSKSGCLQQANRLASRNLLFCSFLKELFIINCLIWTDRQRDRVHTNPFRIRSTAVQKSKLIIFPPINSLISAASLSASLECTCLMIGMM